MKLVAVVGSRRLPVSWAGQVSQVVKDLVRRGNRIGSGGALGADLFALQALVRLGREACDGSRVFLPGSVMQASSSCRELLLRFEAAGGSIVPGTVAGQATTRSAYIGALFSRSVELVKASSGVVAFVSGDSKGTWFTCEQAARLGKQVVVFSADGPRTLHSLGCGRWVPVHSWEVAWRWEFSVPAGERCKHGIMVECCGVGTYRGGSHGEGVGNEDDQIEASA
jgi:predicted Rossmann fold nucleotide-binding protein DprA/Smf involved in DNA uptake